MGGKRRKVALLCSAIIKPPILFTEANNFENLQQLCMIFSINERPSGMGWLATKMSIWIHATLLETFHQTLVHISRELQFPRAPSCPGLPVRCTSSGLGLGSRTGWMEGRRTDGRTEVKTDGQREGRLRNRQ